jgi:hypothetical protein
MGTLLEVTTYYYKILREYSLRREGGGEGAFPSSVWGVGVSYFS